MTTNSSLIIQFDHFQLTMPPTEEAKVRAFWSGLLSLPELAKPATLAIRGGVWFALPDGRQLHYGVVENFSPATKGHPAFICRDLDMLTAQLTAAHIPIAWDAELAPRQRFYTHDPFGNRLEFLEPAVASQSHSD